MSANDNAMTRFLFAILQQKCLKDIDWNKVAHDPILAQEITNGHAARMRYSRFRSAMLGIEPQKRTRNANRSRVTKKKKDDAPSNGRAAKREPDAADADEPETPGGLIKREPRSAATPQTLRHETPMMMASPRVKEERMFSVLDQQQQQPTSQQQQQQMFGLSDMQARMQMRMLTPCSDSDVLSGAASQYTQHATHSHAHSPAGSELLHADPASFDYCRDPATQHHQHHHHHEAGPWHHHQGPYVAGFGDLYATGTGADGAACFPTGAFGEQDGAGHHHPMHHHHAGVHQHQHHHSHHGVVPDELGVHNALLEHEIEVGQGMVKHEEWDAGAY